MERKERIVGGRHLVGSLASHVISEMCLDVEKAWD